jgi:hypothetical protein
MDSLQFSPAWAHSVATQFATGLLFSSQGCGWGWGVLEPSSLHDHPMDNQGALGFLHWGLHSAQPMPFSKHWCPAWAQHLVFEQSVPGCEQFTANHEAGAGVRAPNDLHVHGLLSTSVGSGPGMQSTLHCPVPFAFS